MKHVFECGIVGESNGSPAGDAFLAQMVEADRPALLPHGEIPDDFTIEVHERDMMMDPCFPQRIEILMRYMIDRGYETLRWTDHDKWCVCIRFRRAKK